MFGLSLRNWNAWMPGRETAEAWRQWASNGEPAADALLSAGEALVPPPLKEIPPLLRRRADLMGRAALHVLSRPEMPYKGQSIVLCSRLGEFSRSYVLQEELAREGMVSPQQFSMSVHNATGGLFMMAQKAHAPLTALSAGEGGALAGLQEAAAQLAEGCPAVWLVYCEEPLIPEYRSLAAKPDEQADYFAFLLELVPGDEYRLVSGEGAGTQGRTASALELLAFFLRPAEAGISLSSCGGWMLRRQPGAGDNDA
jgi:hypothetical protein